MAIPEESNLCTAEGGDQNREFRGKLSIMGGGGGNNSICNRTAHIIVSLINKDACLIYNGTFKNFLQKSTLNISYL